MDKKELFERWKKKGGTFHASLEHGCVLSITGEKSKQLVRPMPELIPKPRPDVIYL